MSLNNPYILLQISLNANDPSIARLLIQVNKTFNEYVNNVAFGILFKRYGCHDYDHQVKREDLRAIKWLHANSIKGCSSSTMDWAARCGYLDIVKWLHANRTEGCTTNAMDLAAGGGYLDIVKWLHTHRTEGCTKDAMDYVATSMS